MKTKIVTNKSYNPILNWRRSQNMSQKLLAEVVGVSIYTLDAWEKDINRPQKKYVSILAALIGIDKEELGNQLKSANKGNIIENIKNLDVADK